MNQTNMKTPTKPDAARSAGQFGCTIEQAKRMFAKNADGFRAMAAKAESTGKKVSGYTAAELRLSETQYREASL